MLMHELIACDNKNTPYFSFDKKEYLCKCVDVYDGDTITVVFKPYPNVPIYKYSIRLLGIDTPEIRTKNLDEKKKGIEVRDILREKILGKIITIKCGKFDKYGRLLANIFDEGGQHINKWLVDNKYAYEYFGGTKRVFSETSS